MLGFKDYAKNLKTITISNQNWDLFTENFSTLFDTTTEQKYLENLKLWIITVEIMNELIR